MRYQTQLTINQPDEFVSFIINDFFDKEGFKYVEYDNEMVWKKGNGILTAPQFMKIMYQNGTIFLEAWLKFAILPGVYAGEMGLEGFWGFALKEVLRGRVNTLMGLLSQNGAVNPQMPQQTAGVQQ